MPNIVRQNRGDVSHTHTHTHIKILFKKHDLYTRLFKISYIIQLTFIHKKLL